MAAGPDPAVAESQLSAVGTRRVRASSARALTTGLRVPEAHPDFARTAVCPDAVGRDALG
ncbi:MAG: hypothetical protein NTU41_05675 [Chloroflexi bacterium]|nr:hypothetical protein [Chloroflexota bacterium]